MALKEYYWEFTQSTPAMTWNISTSDVGVPSAALHVSITEVFATGGTIIQPDSQLVSPDGLQLSFGVTEVSGTAVGKYYLEVPGSSVITDAYGNTVNITVTQNGGTAPTGATF